MKMDTQLKKHVARALVFALTFNPLLASMAASPRPATNTPPASVDQKSVAIQLDPSINPAKTDIKQLPSGISTINIATPSAKGVSHNFFSEFNVAAEGVIFNNSAAPVLTQLGGWSDGNRRLTGGEARVILSEVTGANRSNLLGQIEVAGKSAEFILANANGITCDGCGFINTPRVTLVTGRSQYGSDGSLGFTVKGGDVLIQGQGLNASNIDQFDIVTRAAKINADIYAKKLNFYTGTNHFDYQSGELTAIDNTGNPSVEFALDSSALGGMYANSIRLVGTEKGVGVNTEGLIQSVTDLELTADGDIHLKSAQANERASLASAHAGVTTDETVYAKNISLSGATELTNNGNIYAANSLALKGSSFDQSGNVYVGLTDDGHLTDAGNLKADLASSMNNNGSLYVGGSVALTTPNLKNAGQILLQTAPKLSGIGEIDNRGGLQFNSAEDVQLIADKLNNSGDISLSGAGRLSVAIKDGFDNQQGNLSATGALQVAAGNFNNNQGTVLANKLAITSGIVGNQAGMVQANDFSLQATSLDNTDGQVLVFGDNGLAINLSGDFNNHQGILYAKAASADIAAKNINNVAGYLVTNNSTQINLQGALDNTDGLLQTGDLVMNAQALDNKRAKMFVGNLSGNIGSLSNSVGAIQSKTINITGEKFANDNGSLSAVASGDSSLNFAASINNINGSVIQNQGGNFSLVTAFLANQDSAINAKGAETFSLIADLVNNVRGVLLGDNQFNLVAANIDNTQGYVKAGTVNFQADVNNTGGVIQTTLGTMSANGSVLDNTNGIVAIKGDLDISLRGQLTNTSGLLSSENLASINAGSIENLGGEISATRIDATAGQLNNRLGKMWASSIQMNLTGLDNSQGLVAATDANAENSLAIIIANTFTNLDGIIFGKGKQFQLVADALNNQRGIINHEGDGAVTLRAGALINREGKINAVGDATITAESLDNYRGVITVAKNSNLIIANDFENKEGWLQSALEQKLSATTIDNQSGFIGAQNLDINANGVVNGHMEASSLGLHLNKLVNEGDIIASGKDTEDFVFDVKQFTNSGILDTSSTDMLLDKASLINNQGSIIHRGTGELQIVSGNTLDNSFGAIATRGSLRLNAGSINNHSGQISAAQNFNGNLTALNNASGIIDIGGNFSLALQEFDNSSGKLSIAGDDTTSISVNGLLNNTGGSISYSGANALNISAATIANANQALIASNGNLDIRASQSLSNTGSQIIAVRDAKLVAASMDNQLGSIESEGLTLAANAVDNSGGSIFSKATEAGGFLMDAQNLLNNKGHIETRAASFSLINTSLDNQQGELIHQGSGDLLISQSQLNNQGGIISTQGSANIAVDNLTNDNAEIVAAKNIHLAAAKVSNKNGLVQAGDNLWLKATSLINDGTANLLALGNGVSTLDVATLENAAQISTNGDWSITATNFTNTGEVNGSSAISLDVKKLTNAGLLATKNFAARADEFSNTASGKLMTSRINNKGTSFINAGNINAVNGGENSSLDYETLVNLGKIEFGNANANILGALNNQNGQLIYTGTGSLVVDASQFNNQSGIVSATQLVLKGTGVDNTAGNIISDSLLVNVDHIDNNQGLLQADNNLQLQASSLTNANGKILSAGTGLSTINIDALDNNGGIIAANNLQLTATSAANRQGKVSAKTLSIIATDFDNSQGVIAVAAGAGSDLQVAVTSTLNNQAGVIQSNAENFALSSGTLLNGNGELLHLGTGIFSLAADDLDNNSTGNIYAANDLQLNIANRLANKQANIEAANDLTLHANNLDNNGGTIVSSHQLAMQANQVDNYSDDSAFSALIQGGVLSLSLGQELNNQTDANIEAGTILISAGAAVINNNGQILASDANANALSIYAKELHNAGDIQSHGNGSLIQAGVLSNQGKIAHQGAGIFSINSDSLDNLGLIDGQEDVAVRLSGNLANTGGQISAAKNLVVQAQQFSNNQGLVAADHLQLTVATDLENSGGEINASSATLNANSIRNIGVDALLNAAHLSINAQAVVENLSGAVINANQLQIAAPKLDNSGLVQADAADLSGKSLSNQNGKILAFGANSDALTLSFINGVDNSLGFIESKGNGLAINGAVDNRQGVLLLSGSGLLAIGAVDNDSGQIISNGNLQIAADANSGYVNNQNGVMQALGDVTLTANKLDNTLGTIFAGSALRLYTNTLDNSAGLLHAGASANNSLLLSGGVKNLGGLIETSAGNLNLSGINFDNTQGTFHHLGGGQLIVNSIGAFLNNEGTIDSAGDLNIAVTGAGAVLQNQGGLLKGKTVGLQATDLIDNTNQGAIQGESIKLSANNINNNYGLVIATATQNGSITFVTPNLVDNRFGELRSAANSWTLDLDLFDNTGGTIAHTGAGTLRINSNLLLANSGLISSMGDLQLNAQGISNSGSVIADGNLQLNSGGKIENLGAGLFYAGAAFDLSASNQSFNNLGQVEAQTGLNILLGQGALNNSGKIIAQTGNVDLVAKDFVNTNLISQNTPGAFTATLGNVDNSGTLQSAGDLSIGLETLINNGLISADDLVISGANSVANNGHLEANTVNLTGNTLTNSGSLIAAGSIDSLVLYINNLVNTSTGLISTNSNNLQFHGAVTNSGKLSHAGSGVLMLGDAGVVDVSGGMVATAGTAQLAGNLSGIGNIFAQTGIDITGSSTFNNSGAQLYTTGDISIFSAVNNTNGGTIIADGKFLINSIGVINNNDGLMQGADLDFHAASITNINGSIISTGSGSASLVADSIDNSGKGSISFTNSQASVVTDVGDINNNNGTISHQGNGTLAVNAAGDINNTMGSIKSDGSLQATAIQLNNSHGDLNAEAFSLYIQTLDNSNGKIAATGTADNIISASNILNNSGSISTNANLNLVATDLDNRGGVIQQSSPGALMLTLGQLTGDSGSKILSNDTLRLKVTSRLDNAGTISAQNKVVIDAVGLNNTGTIDSSNGEVELWLGQSALNNFIGAEISGSQKVSVAAGSLNNTGKVLSDDTVSFNLKNLIGFGAVSAGSQLELHTTDTLSIGLAEHITSKGNVLISSDAEIDNFGQITAGKVLTLSGLNLWNAGTITGGAGGESNIAILGELNNANGGRISSEGNLTIDSVRLLNAGIISAGKDLTITNRDDLTNGNTQDTTNKVIFAGGALAINAASITNTRGTLFSMGDMNLGSQSFIRNDEARIESLGAMTLSATDAIINTRAEPALIQDFYRHDESRYKFEITGSSDYSNPNYGFYGAFAYFTGVSTTTYSLDPTSQPEAVIAASSDMTLAGGDILNTYGSINVGGNLNIAGTDFINTYKSGYTEVETSDITYHVSTKCDTNDYTDPCYVGTARYVTVQSDRTTESGPVIGTIHVAGNINGTLADKVVNRPANFIETNTTADYSGQGITTFSGTSGDGADKLSGETVDFTLYDGTAVGLENTNLTAGQSAGTSNQQATSGGGAVNAGTGTGTSNWSMITSGASVAALSQRASVNDSLASLHHIVQQIDSLDSAALHQISLDASLQKLVGNGTSSDTHAQAADSAVDAAASLLAVLDQIRAGENPFGDELALANFVAALEASLNPEASNPDLASVQQAKAIPVLLARATPGVATNIDFKPVDFTVLPLDFNLDNLSGLYTQATSPDSNYLIETRPEFTDYSKFLGSDYLLEALGYTPDQTLRRLGDAFFENQLVRDAMMRETNQRYLAGQTNDFDQMQMLMDNAVSANQNLHLSVGVELTAEQAAALTQDIFWLVRKKVNGQTVLVPHLYLTSVSRDKLAASSTAIAAGGSVNLSADGGMALQGKLSAGRDLSLSTKGNFEQNGMLVARGDIRLIADQALTNKGQIAASSVDLTAGGLLDNAGNVKAAQRVGLTSVQSGILNTGKVVAGSNLVMNAQGDIRNQQGYLEGDDVSLTSTRGSVINRTEASKITAVDGKGRVQVRTQVGPASTIVSHSNLLLDAGKDLDLQGSQFAAANDITFKAGNDILLDAIEKTFSSDTSTRKHTNKTSRTDYQTVGINAGNNLSLSAGRDLNAQGAQLAAAGDLTLASGRDINLAAVAESTSSENLTKRKKLIDKETTHKLVSIQSGGNTVIRAGQDDVQGCTSVADAGCRGGDLNLTGVTLNAQGDVALAAARDTNISAVVDSDYHFDQKTKKRSFGRSTTKTNETLTETVTGGDISAGGNLLVNAHGTDEGAVIAEKSGKVNLLGARLTAGGSAVVAADEDLNVSGIEYNSLDYHRTVKKGAFGLSGSDKGGREADKLLQNAEITSHNNLALMADNINLAATNVVAGGNINLEAVDKLLVSAGDISRQAKDWSTKSAAFSDGKLYSKTSHQAGDTQLDVQASLINAGGDMVANLGSGEIVGSDVAATGNILFKADAGDITVRAATTHDEHYTKEEHMSVSLGDVAKSLSRPDQLVKNENGRASLTLADAHVDKADSKTTVENARSANIDSEGSIRLNATAGAVNILGSNLTADSKGAADAHSGNLILSGATGVTIGTVTTSTQTDTHTMTGDAQLSVAVQHQAAEVVVAAKNVEGAKDKLEQAKKDYKNYERDLDTQKANLKQLEADYANQVPGVNLDDLNDLRSRVSDMEGDKNWYSTGIALAAVNLTSATTALVQQIAAAAQSTGTYGFNAGVQLDIDASKTHTTSLDTHAQGSTLTGNNLIIQTGQPGADGALNTAGTATTIEGSSLFAKNQLGITTGDLNILASQDTHQLTNEKEHGHVTAQVTVYGASGGASISGSYDRSHAKESSTTNTNSQLQGDLVSITTSGDALIRGANINAATQLDVNIAGDLTLESVQNRSHSKNDSIGISGGISLGGSGKSADHLQGTNNIGSLAGANGGFNVANGSSDSKQTLLTSLTSNGTANVNVTGHTQLNGALLTTVDDQGNDLGQLNFSTGSFGFTDLKNTNTNRQMSGGLSTSVSLGKPDLQQQNNAKNDQGDPLRLNTSHLGYKNTSTDDASKTLATLGNGNISIGGQTASADQPLDALAGLNRDVTATQKDLWSIDRTQGNLDVSLDHRLLTKDGRNEIKDDAKRTGILAQSIADLGSEPVSILGGKTEGTTGLLDHIADNQNYYSATKAFTNPANAEYINTLTSGVASPEAKQTALTTLANSLAEQTGMSPVEALTLVQDKYNLNTRAYDNTTISQQITGAYATKENGEGVLFSVDNNQATTTDTVINLGHEFSHHQDATRFTGVEQTATFTSNRDGYAELMGNALTDYLDYNLTNNGYSALGATNQHNGSTTDRGTIERNTAVFNSLDVNSVDYRQLAGKEIQLIQQTSGAYAKKYRLTDSEAQTELINTALARVDSNHENTPGSAEANAWLNAMSVGMLSNPETQEHDVRLFDATDKQKHDHAMFADVGLPASTNVNDQATQFILNGKDTTENLEAYTRVVLAPEAFANNQYGKNDVVFGQDVGLIKKDFMPTNPKAYGSEGLGRNGIVDAADVNRLTQFSPVVTGDAASLADYLGLSPSRITQSSSSLLSNGQKEIFTAAVSWLTNGSSTPTILLNDNATIYGHRNQNVQTALGGYLTPSEQRIVTSQVDNLQPGQTLDISTALQISAGRATQSNENFLTGFAKDLHEQANTTNFWDEPSAHISNVTVGFAEHTGQNWELLFTDKNAPAFMRSDAASGVANDVIMLATLYPTGAGVKAAQESVMGGNAVKVVRTGEEDFYDGGNGLNAFYKKAAADATQNDDSNVLYLGRFTQNRDSYQIVATNNGGTFFQINNWLAISKEIGSENMWNINKEFIQKEIDSGKDIILTHDPYHPRDLFGGDSYEKEIEFLKSNGYTTFEKTAEGNWKAVKGD